MKRQIAFMMTLLLIVMASACSDNEEGITPVDTNVPAGQLTSATDCKQFNGPAMEAAMTSSESCIEYTYDADKKTLYLTHVNAGFNCCPGELSAAISVDENIITIAEKEREAGCHCNCLFDLTFEITSLPSGTYRIVVVEPYRHADDTALDFEVDLNTAPAGTNCVPRMHYPWGL